MFLVQICSVLRWQGLITLLQLFLQLLSPCFLSVSGFTDIILFQSGRVPLRSRTILVFYVPVKKDKTVSSWYVHSFTFIESFFFWDNSTVSQQLQESTACTRSHIWNQPTHIQTQTLCLSFFFLNHGTICVFYAYLGYSITHYWPCPNIFFRLVTI